MRLQILIRILIVLLALTLFVPTRSSAPQPAEAIMQKQEEPAIQKPPEEVAVNSYPQAIPRGQNAEVYRAMLHTIAKAKGLSDEKIREIEVTIEGNGHPKCPNGESGWNRYAVGDKGTSFGIVQIHLPAHPHVTKEQAFDPTFALTFITDEFIRGNEWKWTCWKAVYDN